MPIVNGRYRKNASTITEEQSLRLPRLIGGTLKLLLRHKVLEKQILHIWFAF